MARNVPPPNTVPESYRISTSKTFSFQSRTTNEVLKLPEKLQTEKATGLDNLPSKMSKVGAGVLAPSLDIFLQWISSGIVQIEWRLTRETPIFTKGKQDINNYRQISRIPVVAKVFERTV